MKLSENDARGALQYCAKIAPDYLTDLYRAAIDGRIFLGLILRHGADIRFEADVPQIVIISDDIGRAGGPGAFNPKTLVPLVERCGAATVISVPAERHFYADALGYALQKQTDVLIVETMPDHEAAWLQYLARINRSITWGVWTSNATGATQ